MMKTSQRSSCAPGFALIVTLLLMILMTIIAVGLLSLSSVSLRSASQGEAQQSARANARVALMLAIGDLQKQLGSDTRVSVTADQTASNSTSDESAAPRAHRHWAGAYKAWPAGKPSDPRPTPEFLQWLVSGDPRKTDQKNFPTTTAGGDTVEIVGTGTVGPGDTVTVPKLSLTLPDKTSHGFAWWVGDEGVKALIAQAKHQPEEIADARSDQQTVPASNLKSATFGANSPFADVDEESPALARLCSWESVELLGDSESPLAIGGLYHDFTTWNRGLLTNVRVGGFRKDLSMELERPINRQPDPARTALYEVEGEPGINLQELWAYYNLPSTNNASGRGLRWSTSPIPFTTGGSIPRDTPYLQLIGNANACTNDDFFFYKMPVIIGYQMVLSLQTRVVNGVNRVHIVTDPILTFWNPLDVPVVIPSGTTLTVKYWQVPYNLKIRKNNTTYDCPIAAISAHDGNFLSLEVGGLDRLVFKPGEVIKMSQYQDTLAVSAVRDRHALAGKAGFLFGKGVAWEATSTTGQKIDVGPNDRVRFEAAQPNDLTAGATSNSGRVLPGYYQHSRHFSLTHHEYYVGADRGSNSLGIGGIYLDWDFGNKRVSANRTRTDSTPGTKSVSDRYKANLRPDVFKTFNDGRSIPTSGSKMPVMMLSFEVKTETTGTFNTRTLSRFNPKALQVDFYDLRAAESEMLPYQYSVELLNGWKSANDSLQQDASGRGYFGAAMNAQDGSNYVTTHSVPREPLVSLAALQHSFANGFNIQKPKPGYATLNAREPLLPQISHAIGNSLACPVLDSDKTEGTLPGGRPMADHSYLANQALWDDWFFSGIAPQNGITFGKRRTQIEVADDFFSGEESGRLPVSRYRPNTRGEEPSALVEKFISSGRPRDEATDEIASYMVVDGLFNVNSTSVEAWKSLLGSRNGRPIVVRDDSGKESIGTTGSDDTAVSCLFGPQDLALKVGNPALNNPAQWVGYRALKESEIESLARAIVREVRKRGPFLSLADFVNRRVGSDKELARAGTIQSALDSDDVPINDAFNQGSRASGGGTSLAFAEAEQGAISYGIPGIVKQADILTPIAPLLSARSDTFVVRGYGEKTDPSGKVIARACCEAVVTRGASFVDPSDPPEKAYDSISQTNKTFGRRFEILSFRWINDI